MQFISDIILEVNSNTAYTVVGAKQGDNDTRIVDAHLVQNGVPYVIEDGAKATFRFRKPDGKAIVNDAIIKNNAEGLVSIGLTSQTLAVAGRGYADIVLTKNRQILSTVSFIIIIMAAPQVLSEVVSSNEFDYIENIVNSARETIYESEAWAKGTRAGIPVTADESFSYEFNSPGSTIGAVDIIQEEFMAAVGYNPGAQRVFTFTYKNQGYWSLITQVTMGGTSVTSEATRYDSLDGFGINITYNITDHPNNNDTITVSVSEPDITFEKNAKYYADHAVSAKYAIDNLELATNMIQPIDNPFVDNSSVDKVAIDDIIVDESSPGLGTVTINKTQFLSNNPEQGEFSFIYNGSEWRYNDASVNLATWGISYTGTEYFNSKIIINYSQHQKFTLNIPRGPRGDVYFMTFEVDTDEASDTVGQLLMYRPVDEHGDPTAEGVDFEIIDSGVNEGCLGVTISMGGDD